MKVFSWDEISREITEYIVPLPDQWQHADDDESGEWKLEHTYSNGVKFFLSERGHVALECQAESKEQAWQMFYIADETFRRMCE